MNEYVGELLAIREFNDANPLRKIAKVELYTTESVHGSALPPAGWQQARFRRREIWI